MGTATQTGVTPEYAVSNRDEVLAALEQEMYTTAKVISAIPEKQARTFRPDPKARTAWELAWHIVSSDVQELQEVAEMKFTGRPRYKEPGSISEMCTRYKQHLPDAIAKVRKLSATDLLKPVSFFGVFNFPDYVYIGLILRHSIHHRGQLSTFLRPMGSKVPSIYGGSADEQT